MNAVLVRKHIIILVLAFIVAVLFRLPNLNRPLSKHHEFNTAVILNGIISWREAGGASTFNYIPLMTYQGAENRLLARGCYTDAVGNHLYLSLGPGWYVLPYIVFSTFRLPFTPLSLQLLNLCIQLITLLALYRLVWVVCRRYSFLSTQFPLYSCLVFLFAPGPLWYFGNGYVHAAISLPFAILFFTQFLQFAFQQRKFNLLFIVQFLICGVAGIYIDWFSFFLLSVLAVCALVFFIKEKKVAWLKMTVLCGLTAVVGVAHIWWQFAAVLGNSQVLEYWVKRAGGRSFNNEEASFISHLVSLATNIISCAGLTILGAAIVVGLFSKNKKLPFPVLPFLLLTITCLCYNGVFFNWSYVHEFSMVPATVLLSICLAYWLTQILTIKKAAVAFIVFVILSLGQYYFINPPGNISRSGTPYVEQKQLGEQIGQRVPNDYRIFSPLHNDPVVEYYAHRSFTSQTIRSFTEAKFICDSLQVNKAVWLEMDSLHLKAVHYIK